MVFFNADGEQLLIYKIFMKGSGIWPLDVHTLQSKMVFSITILAQLVIAVMCLTHPIAECLPVRIKQIHSARISSTLMGVVMQISLRVYCQVMAPLIEAMIEDWSTVLDPKQRKILTRHNQTGSMIFYAYAVYFMYQLIISHVKTLPFVETLTSTDKPDNCVHEDAIRLNLLPVLSFISWGYTTLPKISGTMLFWSSAMHLAGQLKMLKEEFQDLLHIEDKKARRKELRRLVDRHNELLDLSDHLETSFNFFVALKVLLFQISICGSTLQLVTSKDSLFSMLKFSRVVNIGFIAMMLYVYYYAGEYLTGCCEEIGDVFTQCKWYSLSKESRANACIIIARCQKPKVLTAIKMYELNFWNLKYVFNALYSYMSCIVALQDGAG